MTRTFRMIPVAVALAMVALIATTASAREPVVPQPSPLAKVSQQVGVAEVSIEYSSPGVKGRTIFGDLVPYGELWRTGANAATRITFSHDVTILGKKVPAGAYSLFTLPAEDGAWTVVLNAVADLPGTRGYDEKKDVARFEVKPDAVPARERMTFLFADTTDDATHLDLEWDTVRVRIPVQIDTPALAMANVDKAVGDASGTLANAARYLLGQKKDLGRALALAQASVAVQPTWYAMWVQAQIQKELGLDADALASAKKAYALGEKAEYFFWKDDVAKAIEAWK